jgi:glycosyltransferase involved in cell wall biosynthesis
MAAYVSFLAQSGYPVTVFSSLNGTDGESVRLDSKVRLVQEPASAWGGFRHSPALWRQAEAADIDLIHSYGLWTDVNRLAGDIARRRGLPHLLAPCGMLAPGALQHHGWKKIPARLWFQDRALREARCLHAKSHKEYEDMRRFGLRNPVAIIPNPVGGPVVSNQWSVGSGRRAGGPGHRTVLFLGRLHPVKGVERLVEAWIRIQTENGESRRQKAGQRTADGGRRTGDWVLVLAGPDEAGMRPGLEAALRARGCAESVIFTGQLDEVQKWVAYQAADLFVMPSDFENFGNSIVEAMLSGLPVITTTGTPWKELPAQGAGWCVEPNVEAVRDALDVAMAMTDDARQEMGRRATDFASRFRPEQAAADLIQVYMWLLGRGPKPGCVV